LTTKRPSEQGPVFFILTLGAGKVNKNVSRSNKPDKQALFPGRTSQGLFSLKNEGWFPALKSVE